MKKSLYAISAAVGIMSFAAPAEAGNRVVNDALKSREDLSIFYNALVNTGVIDELSGTVPYTVFAPTNDSFRKLTADQYPCLYSVQCQEELKDLLRNHIVPNERDVSTRNGMFSIDDRHISVAEPRKGQYTVSGKEVIRTHQLGGGILYEIEGVIADERELATFTKLRYIPVATSDTVTTVTEKNYVTPSGEPGGYTQTTTTTTRNVTPNTLTPAAGY